MVSSKAFEAGSASPISARSNITNIFVCPYIFLFVRYDSLLSVYFFLDYSPVYGLTYFRKKALKTVKKAKKEESSDSSSDSSESESD